MAYQQALELAWSGLQKSTANETFTVRMLSDTYAIDRDKRLILSGSCNVPAKDHTAILILHYLTKRMTLNSPARPTGEWIDFKSLDGGEGYYSAFKKRTIDRVVKKFSSDPDALLKVKDRMPAEPATTGDVGIVVRPFDDVPVLIAMWRGDSEFGPDANILFDRTISQIFCTEDVVVLTELIVHML